MAVGSKSYSNKSNINNISFFHRENTMENAINTAYQTDIPFLAELHREADTIQTFMNVDINLQDPASLTYRLATLDAYMARLSDMMSRAKTVKEKEKYRFIAENEDILDKLTATISNRRIEAHLQEYSAAYNRLDTMYHTIEQLARDLVTQISYIKKQMENFGG